MALSVLVPYLPLTLAFLVGNLQIILPLGTLDFKAIKSGPLPYNTVVFIPSTKIDFFFMNSRWIPIITAIPIFGYFGMTKDAINSYRRQLVALRLGKFFPDLEEEYDPDRTRGSSQSRSAASTSNSRAPLNTPIAGR
jgi:pheromone a factor receptor